MNLTLKLLLLKSALVKRGLDSEISLHHLDSQWQCRACNDTPVLLGEAPGRFNSEWLPDPESAVLAVFKQVS